MLVYFAFTKKSRDRLITLTFILENIFEWERKLQDSGWGTSFFSCNNTQHRTSCLREHEEKKAGQVKVKAQSCPNPAAKQQYNEDLS